MENSMEVPQKTESRVAIQPSNPTAWAHNQQNHSSESLHHPFTAVPVMTATTWKQHKGPSTDEWQYNSAVKWMKYCHSAATGMDLWVIILSEVGRSERQILSLIVESKIRHKWTYLQNNRTDTQNRLMVGCREGKNWEGWNGSFRLADAKHYTQNG